MRRPPDRLTRPSHRRRLLGRATIAALTVLVATVVSGCADSAGGPHGSAAALATPTAGSTVPGAVMSRQVQAAVRAAGTVQFRMSDATSRASGALDLRHGDLRAAMTAKDGRTTVRAVVLPKVTYVSDGQRLQGKHWIRVDEPARHAVFKSMRAELVAGLVLVDPGYQARAWALGGPFTAGETANLGAEMATEYDASLSESTMAKVVPAQARKAFLGTGQDSENASLRVWLNERSLPLKMQIAWTEGKKRVSLTVTYVNWHTTAAVKAPRSSDVLSGRF